MRHFVPFSLKGYRDSGIRFVLAALLGFGGIVPAFSEDLEVNSRSALSAGASLKHAYPITLDEGTDTPAGRRILYIGGQESNNILAWDLDGRAILHEAKDVREPFFLRYHPFTKTVVALAYDNSYDSLLIVFDRFLNEVRRINLGGAYAYSLAMTDDGKTAYVGVFGKILSVDLETGVKSDLTSVSSYYYPTGLCLDADRNRLIVVGMGWVIVSGEYVLRTAVMAYDLGSRAFTQTMVLGDGLYSWDAVLDRDELFIANTDDNSVHMVDIAQFQVIAKITGISCAQRLILHPGRKWIYVIDNYLDRFHIIDRVHRVLYKTVYPGDDPSGITFDSKGRCYTANLWSNDFSVIDLEKEEVVERVALSGGSPHSLYFDSQDRRVYVTNGSSNGIQILDASTGKVIDVLTMPDGAFGGALTVDRSRERIYVADDWRSGLAIYPTDSAEVAYQRSDNELKFIALPGVHPSGVASAPRNLLCVPFVADGRLKLGLIDAVKEELDTVIDLGPGLQTGGVAVDPKKNRAYVADYSGAQVISVDLKDKTVLAKVYVERKPTALSVHPVSGYIYVCNPGSNSIAVLADEPFEALGFVDVGEKPTAIAFAPSKARIYVVNSGDGTLSAIDELEHRVVETLQVAPDLLSVVVDPETELVYVASPSGQEVLTVRDNFRLIPGITDVRRADATYRLREAYAYPNPARSMNPILRAEVGVADRVLFQIFDVAGALVHEASVTAAPQVVENRFVYEYRWDVSGVAPGVYLVAMRAQKAGEEDLKTTFKVAVIK